MTEWQALYESAPCGLMAATREGLIRRPNATLCRWLGRTAEELTQVRLQDLLTPGGRIFMQTHLMPLLKMQGSVSEVKLEVRRADGSLVPMVVNVVRQEPGGEEAFEFAWLIAEDRHTYEKEIVAGRKRAEELLARQRQVNEALALAQARLTTALEAGALHVWEADLETGQREFSPGVAALLGRPVGAGVSMEEFRAAIVPEDLEPARQALAGILDDAAKSFSATWRLDGEDGVQRTVLATARAVPNAEGRITRAVGVMQDVSALADRRREAEDRALFAEQMIGIVSHDLRNPLSTIRLGSQVLRLGAAAEQRDALLGSIERATERASRLIGDLLDFTRARLGGGLGIVLSELDLHAVVHEQVEELKVAYPHAQLVHVRRGSEGLLHPASADRIAQLVGNLVANAITHGGADTPVTITTEVRAAGWKISVHNQGPPIPGSLCEQLFEPVLRRSQVGDDQRRVGLGLYIVAQIARAHHAQVSCVSDARSGTVFEVVAGALH